MNRFDNERRAAYRPYRVITIGCVLAFSLGACGKPAATRELVAKNGNVVASKSGRIVACTLMPKGEVNLITGASYTETDSSDDGHSSSSDCHYSSPTDPAGLSLSIQWINPADYSSTAEHAALQKAEMGGARLGGKLAGSVVPEGAGAMLHLPSGPVEGVGDEATINMLLLSARKGDYLVMVQITSMDMMALATDSTVGPAIVEKEKAIARKVFTRL